MNHFQALTASSSWPRASSSRAATQRAARWSGSTLSASATAAIGAFPVAAAEPQLGQPGGQVGVAGLRRRRPLASSSSALSPSPWLARQSARPRIALTRTAGSSFSGSLSRAS